MIQAKVRSTAHRRGNTWNILIPRGLRTNKSPKPNAPYMDTLQSCATDSSNSPAPPRASTESWRPKPTAWSVFKGYTTNLTTVDADFVIDAYHQLRRIEKSFRMSKQDLLQARPIYHHKRDSIEAHLTIVFAALAVSHHIETQTGWSIKKFVRTARRYRTVQIRAGR